MFLALLVAARVLVHVPLGDYMFRVYTPDRDNAAERVVYRLIGADPRPNNLRVPTPEACSPFRRLASFSCSSSS